ncbi:hypothetical protein NLI96_g7667 [Meripilus lineatus]|uniref:Uncharacterized protein n=1 Tax=Meripilus lineatus TaxID=2056292 RepID=A0AAD5V3I7_9APHY|nr:hypothetical protein NLI96_g7667 [Physisporinus lineatus]
MNDTRRLLEAASALSQLLHNAGAPHAFYGSVLNAVLTNAPHADEIYCIVEGGPHTHPFKRVRQACAGSTNVTVTPSPWSDRLHVRYHRLIPAIDIEILPSGEEGPRHLDSSTVGIIAGLPFLTISEFLRAKLKAWAMYVLSYLCYVLVPIVYHGLAFASRRRDHDAQDIIYAFSRYWNRVDINRIPEQDMRDLVKSYPAIAPAWRELKMKYGM